MVSSFRKFLLLGFSACIPFIILQFDLLKRLCISPLRQSRMGKNIPLLNSSMSPSLHLRCPTVDSTIDPLNLELIFCGLFTTVSTATLHCFPVSTVSFQISSKDESLLRSWRVSWNASTKSTAFAKSRGVDWSMSARNFASPRTFEKMTSDPIKVRSSWASKPRASTERSPLFSTSRSCSTRKTAGSLSLMFLQAWYRHAHLVSLSLCRSLGAPWSLF